MKSTRIPLNLLQWLPQGGDGTDTSTEDVEETEDSTEQEEKSDEDEEKPSTVSREELNDLQRKFDAMRKQLQAADRNKSVAQQKLDELERKDKTELENAQTDLKKTQEESTGWREKFLGLARTNAFLIASARQQITWHDPEVAQAAAVLVSLEVGEDGTVDGIVDVIKKLAKEKPFLVNKGKSEESEGGDTNRKRSGSRVGSGGKAKDTGVADGLSAEELRKRFPALRV